MRKGFALLTVLVILASPLFCYGEEIDVKGGGGGGFSFGFQRFDLSKLSEELEIRGFEPLESNSVSIGGGGYGLVGRILLGGEGYGSQQDIVSSKLKASVNTGYGFFNAGYVLFSNNSLRIFPLIGIGGGGINLRVAERGASPSFKDVLDDPKREANISTGNILFQFALGLDYVAKLGKESNGGGMLLGIRVGYIYAPNKAVWKMNEIDISGGPDVRVTGPYIRFIIGGGA